LAKRGADDQTAERYKYRHHTVWDVDTRFFFRNSSTTRSMPSLTLRHAVSLLGHFITAFPSIIIPLGLHSIFVFFRQFFEILLEITFLPDFFQ
jgi:hypothetical protein